MGGEGVENLMSAGTLGSGRNWGVGRQFVCWNIISLNAAVVKAYAREPCFGTSASGDL